MRRQQLTRVPPWVHARARRWRAAARTARERAGFLVEHATKPFAGPMPNWTVYTIFALTLALLISVLGNILLLGIFLLAVYG